MSGVSHLKAADYARVPWRNGGGVTAEIAVLPAGATLASGFNWRLSCAEVASSGPFSAFPGYDRILVQLSGAPMQLVGEGTATTLRIGEAHAFRGEEAIEGVVSEPVRDFNVIVRRGRSTAHVETLRLAAGEAHRSCQEASTGADAHTVAVFVASGAVQVQVANVDYELTPLDTLLVETPGLEGGSSPQALHLKACGGLCVILLVSLRQPSY